MATPFVSFKVYAGTTGTNVEFPTTGGTNSASNLNLMSSNTFDTSGTLYQTYLISIPTAGTGYSYERWFRIRFDGNTTYNQVTNVYFFHSSGSLSDANLILFCGSSNSFITPVNTATPWTGTNMSVATTAPLSTQYVDLTPGAAITTNTAGYSYYGVIQLQVPSSVTTFGDIGVQTMAVQYNVS